MEIDIMSKRNFSRKIQISDDIRKFDVSSIANFIRKHGQIPMSWGYRNATNYMDKALVFRVNGFEHRGVVSITLNHKDLFNVELLSGHYNSKKVVEDVYIDSLINVLDSLIETGNMSFDEYKKKVNESGTQL